MEIKKAGSELRYAINVLDQILPPKQMEKIRDAYKTAKEAMDKQEPVKYTTDSLGYDVYVCPICGKILTHYQYYCDKCGQRLDWRND